FPFFLSCFGHRADSLSFPTRRSSDLGRRAFVPRGDGDRKCVFHRCAGWLAIHHAKSAKVRKTGIFLKMTQDNPASRTKAGIAIRSEEHTSELQSRENLVCRLLLEKKK